jgi:hypothetical protein
MTADLRDDDVLLRHYLLGEVADEERAAIEQRLLGDDDFFELAEAVEGDLLAACAGNEVGPVERERIIRRLASTRTGHARLALAQALSHFGDTRTVTQTMRTVTEPLQFRRREPVHYRPAVVRFTTLAASLAAAALAVLLVSPKVPLGQGALLASKVSGPVSSASATPVPAEPAPMTDAAAAAPGGEPRALGRLPVHLSQAAPAVLTLAFSSLRSGGEPATELHVPRRARTVEIRMMVSDEEPYSSYRATVTDTATGREVWSGKARPGSAAGEPAVTVEVPAAALPAGSIQVELHGIGGGGEAELIGSSVVKIRFE